MTPLRLVLDTNIVVSAALKPDGPQRTVILVAITKPTRLYVTEPILAEQREVLARPELKIRKGLSRNCFNSSGATHTWLERPVPFRSRPTRTWQP